MKKNFNNIATVVRQGREASGLRYSQQELSAVLGYKNGQFISNIERGLCGLPVKMVPKVVEVLKMDPAIIKKAMVDDMTGHFDSVMEKGGFNGHIN